MEPLIFGIMGVSGSGKTTLGLALSQRLGLPFLEGDDYHSPENRDKMSQGIPLNDADRIPWLQALHREIVRNYESGTGCVLACSALKQSYRNLLSGEGLFPVYWIHLAGSAELLTERLEKRGGHFMPPSLLGSQLADLEKPADALTLDIALPLEEKLRRILTAPGERA